MFFNKRPALTTPMDHFLHRDELSEDERSVLDVYMTGVAHTLAGINAVRISNAQDPVFFPPQGQTLEMAEIEALTADFLEQRLDMQSQPLGLCAVMAVLQRFAS